MILSRKLVNKFFLTVVFCGAFFVPGFASGKVFDRVVAKVNSGIVTLSSLEERVEILKQKYKNDLKNLSEKEIQRDALEMIIGEKLQLQQGKKMGFVVDDASVEAAMKSIELNNGLKEGQLATMLESEGRSLESYKNHIRDQILVSKITKFELGSRINISDRKISKYYHDHQKDFWEPGKARVKHILILVEKDSPAKIKKEKFQKINMILAEIKGGKDFSEAARKYSEDISASSGGDVGFVEKGRMVPEFERAVYSLKEGQISDVVETEFGFHIIKVDEIQRGRTLPLKEVKSIIENNLSGAEQKSAYDSWMKELKESAFIEISLFSDPKGNLSADLFDRKQDQKDESNAIPEKSLKKVKRQRSADRVNKKKMQDRWEEMYKSVEKSKKQSPEPMNSPLRTMEEKLKTIKKLRSQERISEAEYQRRKQKLLDEL